jgi:hypothetical protein
MKLTFERSFDVTADTTLDVTTLDGEVDVTAGEPGRVVVVGTVAIRTGVKVPPNAPELAKRVADHPPVDQHGDTVRLRPPSDPEERRATVVSYAVRVPPETPVVAVSQSGATTISGLAGRVVARTVSGAIALTRQSGDVDVTSESGTVEANGIDGDLQVTTTSGDITARDLRSALEIKTTSGTVEASLTGAGRVEIRTESGGISLRGVIGTATVATTSGSIAISGAPAAPWRVSSVSGSTDVTVESAAAFSLDVDSGSGSAEMRGAKVDGAVSERRITGAVAGGGPLLHLRSRSGSIQIKARR